MCRMADRHNRIETGPVISHHHMVNKVLPVKVECDRLSLSRRQVISPGSSKRFGEKFLTYEHNVPTWTHWKDRAKFTSKLEIRQI